MCHVHLKKEEKTVYENSMKRENDARDKGFTDKYSQLLEYHLVQMVQYYNDLSVCRNKTL